MNCLKKSNPSIMLYINAFLWGTSYIWSKMLLEYLPRFFILFMGSLGGLVTTVMFFYPMLRNIRKGDALSCILISGFSVISNIMSILALENTKSTNAAFIVQMSVVITPLLMAVLERKMPDKRVSVSTFVALTGLFLLTCDFNTFSVSIGDLFALGNAFFFSLFLIGQKLCSKKVETAHFMFIYHLTCSVAFLSMALVSDSRNVDFERLATPVFIALAFASIFVSVVTVLLQNMALKHLRPEKATLIYTLEPVTTMILGYILLGERLAGIKPAVGCALILISLFFSGFRMETGDETREPCGRTALFTD